MVYVYTVYTNVVNSHIRSNKIYPKWHYVSICIKCIHICVGDCNKLWPRGPKYLPKMLNTVVSILEGFIRRLCIRINTFETTHRKQETHIHLHE